MIMHSAEIRWFIGGSLSDQMLTWFAAGLPVRVEGFYDKNTVQPFVKREIERLDEYLDLPDYDTVSVKQRQGKLEVKAQVSDPRSFSHPGGVIGRIDQWLKWSFDSDLLKQMEAELRQKDTWRDVGKVRYLLKYSFDSGKLVEVSPDQWPVKGCNVELTRVNVKADVEEWFTLGFEAFGPLGDVVTILEETLSHFFSRRSENSGVQLKDQNSLSYPGWLATLR